MKSNKIQKKLMGATAMLLASAVMLSGVSYAWFTLSTAPEIKGVTVKMTTNQSLEIVLDDNTKKGDSGDAGTKNLAKTEADKWYNTTGTNITTATNYFWGNSLDLSGEAFSTVKDVKLSPMVFVNTKNQPSDGKSLNTAETATAGAQIATETAIQGMTAKYGKDGRADKFEVVSSTSNDALKTHATTNYIGAGTWDFSAENGATKAATYVDFWLRTNAPNASNSKGTTVTVFTNEDAVSNNRANNSGLDAASLGSYITVTYPAELTDENKIANARKRAESITVAFVDQDGKLYGYACVDPDRKVGGNSDTNKDNQLRLVPCDSVGNIMKDATNNVDEWTIDLKENQAQFVRAIIYMNGAKVTNDGFYTDDGVSYQVNLQYQAKNGLTSMPAPAGSSGLPTQD